jgi:hypothetical protein
MDDDYRREKEAFVSDTSGSSIGHINAISLTALVCDSDSDEANI